MMQSKNYNLKDPGQIDLGFLELDELAREKKPMKGRPVGLETIRSTIMETPVLLEII